MKLKSDFIAQKVDDSVFLIPVGEEEFRGIVRSNPTAAFILECLKKETTEEQIVEAMCGKYDAPRERISADVKKMLEKLRGIHALEE